jgi:ubiquinone/menaquinone biosynthesis C-methylase UbiE
MDPPANQDRAGAKGQVTLAFASVMEMPIENNSVDLATAFETVQFWPDMDKSFSEVMRVLRSGGTFLIINRYPR